MKPKISLKEPGVAWPFNDQREVDFVKKFPDDDHKHTPDNVGQQGDRYRGRKSWRGLV